MKEKREKETELFVLAGQLLIGYDLWRRNFLLVSDLGIKNQKF